METDKPVLGNVYDKYTTQNPIAHLLFQNFLQSVRGLLEKVPADSVLEVGCGEGHLSQLLTSWLQPSRICGVDLSPKLFEPEHRVDMSVMFSCQSAYRLGFRGNSFDLVVGAEVLEHLAEPLSALREIQRVAGRYVLLSVPREPIWRVMNFARFTYWRDLGNTPGHLQHWSSGSFVDLVGSLFEILEVRRPLPWTVVLAVKKVPGS
jgi:ubiquinone/menaquinone biosynthesis C-methylase UbiE